MPRATVSTEPERKDLKSLPGGYVTLRRMPYGAWLHRQEMALRLQMEAQGGRGNANATMKGEMQMANKAVTVFEFQQCIVDHNLENDSDERLDFRTPGAVEQLDARVGNEIGEYIREMHEFDLGNSQSASGMPSPEVATSE